MNPLIIAVIFILGAFVLGVALYKLGSAHRQTEQAKDKADEAIENTKDYEKINASDFVSNPATRMRSIRAKGDSKLS